VTVERFGLLSGELCLAKGERASGKRPAEKKVGVGCLRISEEPVKTILRPSCVE